MAEAGYAMVRYADDFVVLCETPEKAREALERIRSWTQEARLTLHPGKTRIVDMRERKAYFDFLGYRFYRTAKEKLTRIVRPKSEKKLRAVLKPRAGCGKSARPVRREEWRNPMRHSYPYISPAEQARMPEASGIGDWGRAKKYRP